MEATIDQQDVQNNVQAELAAKLLRREELSRQTREALQRAAESRRALASGETTANAASQHQIESAMLQDALKDVEDAISGLELSEQQMRERAALETRGHELARLAELAREQREQWEETLRESHETLSKLAEEINSKWSAFNKTKREFARLADDNEHGALKAAGYAWGQGSSLAEGLKAVRSKYNNWPHLGTFQYSLSLAVEAFDRHNQPAPVELSAGSRAMGISDMEKLSPEERAIHIEKANALQ